MFEVLLWKSMNDIVPKLKDKKWNYISKMTQIQDQKYDYNNKKNHNKKCIISLIFYV